MRSFSEVWCSSTNTIFTREGELSISLWDLYRLGGLPLSGSVYDEATPMVADFTQSRSMPLPESLQYLFLAYYRLFCRLKTSDLEGFSEVPMSEWVSFWFRAKKDAQPIADTWVDRGRTTGSMIRDRSAIQDQPLSKLGVPVALADEFSGLAIEDPNDDLEIFLDLCATFKYNGVSDDAIRLRLFKFTLAGRAKTWLNTLPAGSIATSEDLQKKFLKRSRGALPSNSEVNPKEQVKAITRRNGKTLEELLPKEQPAIEEEKNKKGEREKVSPPASPRKKKGKDALPITDIDVRNLSYPSRAKTDILESSFARFLEIFKNLHINIPLLEAWKQMPLYGKFLKEVLSGRRKMEEQGI
ncbi:hypothetical protein H6P81_010033 [Aristolochia fimbriata]|uniref:Retrotransposon gag domain-containing protein n=1 Tax=Aristolochia fimbriata TaxID=158543 RepID=A0AAV7EMJ7_ARIFI|nr:hypothetical protein H6P81_010033 [Aristolochia fimbriata]